MQLKILVTLCSSVNLRYSEIFGDVYYNKGKKLGK